MTSLTPETLREAVAHIETLEATEAAMVAGGSPIEIAVLARRRRQAALGLVALGVVELRPELAPPTLAASTFDTTGTAARP